MNTSFSHLLPYSHYRHYLHKSIKSLCPHPRSLWGFPISLTAPLESFFPSLLPFLMLLSSRASYGTKLFMKRHQHIL